MCRVSEVSHARWRDFDFVNGTWTRYVKAVEGQGVARLDVLPLSEAALALLKSLPGHTRRRPDDLVFPNSEGGVQHNWDRATEIIQEASGTADWHRHDLRRTGSTILKELKVSLHVINTILVHKDPLAREGVSDLAGHYMVATRILTDILDPRVEALEKLAQALEVIARASIGHAPPHAIGHAS